MPQSLATFSPFGRSYLYRRSYLPQEIEPGSYPFPKRQVPQAGRKSFEERCAELNRPAFIPELVDIGLPFESSPLLPNRTQPKREELEASARKRTLEIPLDVVHSLSEDTQAPIRRLVVAHHFGVLRDLFGPSHFFVPSVPLKLYFMPHQLGSDESGVPSNEVEVQPVHTGNLISPTSAQNAPAIDLSTLPTGHLWTLVMSCPDEPLSFDEQPPPNEYVHWVVTNLDPTSTTSGDEVIPYLPPLPHVGTGFHRYIFTLYRQENGMMDISDRFPSSDDFRTRRHFKTLEFYRSLESELTPGGLAFFQSSWDESVRAYYRNVLDCSEPIFELAWPEDRPPPQERFPVANSWVRARRHPHGLPLIRERYGVFNDVSFDVYLDRYRDRKELQEEMILERLKQEGNPLDPNDSRRKRPEFPAALPMPKNMPSWWVKQEMQRRLRRGRWKQLEGHDG